MDSQPLTVLVADDDPAIVRIVSRLVGQAGFQVRTASNGQDALDSILAKCPDLLISDWNMPGLTGLELCRRLRDLTLPHYLYIILLTAKTDAHDLVEGLETGADDYLSKPVQPQELMARVGAGARVVRLEHRLRHLTQCDALTGALSRRTMHEHFEREWDRSKRYSRPLSCVMLDIDSFKKINDTYGHGVGDTTLKQVADLLKSQVRPSDFVGRHGGEEFCVLLTETDEINAHAWAERVRRQLAGMPIPAGGSTIRVTSSFGVVQRMDDTASIEELIDLADQALLVAKQSGRDKVVSASKLGNGLDELRNLAGPLEGVLARDIMTSAVFCPNQNETVSAVADWLLQLRLGSAPVINDDGRLVGIVSEKDLMTVRVSDDDWRQTIRDCMKSNVVSYAESAPAIEIYEFLKRVSIRRVVVVNDGRPTGVISRDSLLRWFRNWFAVGAQSDPPDRARARRERIRAGLLKTAQAVAHRSGELPRILSQPTDNDFVPYVVGEATRLQELLTDLLGHCQDTYST